MAPAVFASNYEEITGKNREDFESLVADSVTVADEASNKAITSAELQDGSSPVEATVVTPITDGVVTE